MWAGGAGQREWASQQQRRQDRGEGHDFACAVASGHHDDQHQDIDRGDTTASQDEQQAGQNEKGREEPPGLAVDLGWPPIAVEAAKLAAPLKEWLGKQAESRWVEGRCDDRQGHNGGKVCKACVGAGTDVGNWGSCPECFEKEGAEQGEADGE